MAVLLVFEWLQKRDIDANKSLQKDSLVSLVFQFDREFSAFRTTLDKALLRPESTDRDEITLRFDLLQSRIVLLDDNPSIAWFAQNPDYRATYPKVKELMSRTELVLAKPVLRRDDLKDLHGRYESLSVEVRNLSMAANAQVQRLLEGQFDTMLKQNDLIVGLTVAQLVLLLLASAGLAWRHLQQAAEQAHIEQELEQRVQQRTHELQLSNQALETAMADLRSAQSQLVLSEKMASLGQLVTNIAHEINTPIGAVKSSGQTIGESVHHLLEQLPLVLSYLDAEGRKLFAELVNQVKQPAEPMSLREERALTRSVVRELEDAELDGVSFKARVMVNLRAHSNVLRYLPLLQHPQSHAIVDAANCIATVVNSADNINTSVDKVSKVVFALKAYSRSEQVGVRMDANLQEGLETVLSIYQNHFRTGITLVRDYQDQPVVFCYPDELNQVWTNLIHNAMQAMKYQGTLTLGLRTEGQFAVVSVTDTGCGIPDDIRDKIFDAFFTTKPTGEGSGLGLDIVNKIINKHNGRIELWSEVGVGSTFTVFLPIDARIAVDTSKT